MTASFPSAQDRDRKQQKREESPNGGGASVSPALPGGAHLPRTDRRRFLAASLSGTALTAFAGVSGLAAALSLPGEARASRVAWRGEWPRTEFSRHMVPLKEILSGQIPRDGVQAIENPDFIYEASAAKVINPLEPVLSLSIKGDSRCYPVGLMLWHQVVNDTVGGVPVLITYSPLTDSFAVFDRRLPGTGGADPLQFGVTGKLRQANILLYDKASESWWQQFDGRCILGSLTGERLDLVTSRMESLQAFMERHKDGKVMFPVTNRPDPVSGPKYGRNPWPGLDSRKRPLGANIRYQGDIPAMTRLIVVENRAWSLDKLQQAGSLTAGNIRLRWSEGMASPLDKSLISRSRDIGQVTVEKRSGNGWQLTPYRTIFAFALPALDPFVKIQA